MGTVMNQSTLFKDILIKIGPLIFMFGCVVILLTTFFVRDAMIDEYVSKGFSIGRIIADASVEHVALNDYMVLQDLVNHYVATDGVKYIFFMDDRYQLTVHTFSPQPPQIFDDRSFRSSFGDVTDIQSLGVFNIRTSILDGELGFVSIGMDIQIIYNHMIALAIKIACVVLILGVLSVFLISRFIRSITDPIAALSRYTEFIKSQNFAPGLDEDSDIKALTTFSNEIGSFSRNYLDLYHQLQEHISSLKRSINQQAAMEKELSIAHSIQMNMMSLNHELVEHNYVTFKPFIQPAKEVGGDFYDVIERGPYVFFLVGDVSGKGVVAALFMTAVLTALRVAVTEYDDPQDIVTVVNRHISLNNPDVMFISLFLGVFDTQSNTLSYVNAGHPCPFIFSNSCESLPGTNGCVLGIDSDYFYDSKCVAIEPNSRMIVFTDGLDEAHNEEDELLGLDRVSSHFSDTQHLSVEEQLASFQSLVKTFVGDRDAHDDITCLILNFSNPNMQLQNPLEVSFRNDIAELIKLQHIIGIFTQTYSISSHISNQLNLVLEELISNTIFYGYDDSLNHTIFLSIQKFDDHVMLQIEDDARPFNPLKDAPKAEVAEFIQDQKVGGLGVKLVASFVDSIDYMYKGNKNILKIKKDLT